MFVLRKEHPEREVGKEAIPDPEPVGPCVPEALLPMLTGILQAACSSYTLPLLLMLLKKALKQFFPRKPYQGIIGSHFSALLAKTISITKHEFLIHLMPVSSISKLL